MTGDKTRVFNIDNFDKLSEIVESVKKTTCKGKVRIGKILGFYRMFYLVVFAKTWK